MSNAWMLLPSARRLTVTRLVTVIAVAGVLSVLTGAAVRPSAPTADVAVASEHPLLPATSTRLATFTTSAAPVGSTTEPGSVPMASVDGVELVVPALDIAAVGFHQGGSGNLTLTPSGEHVVMASRNRGTSATSAVDIAVGADRTVTAPVAGTVTQVEDYSLYGKLTDTLMTIVPDGTDVAIRMMHISDVTVKAGDRVEAGDTIATARALPVSSQVDRHHDGPAGPHVHLDVSRQ